MPPVLQVMPNFWRAVYTHDILLFEWRLDGYSVVFCLVCFTDSCMMVSSNGNIWRVTGPLWGKPPVTGGFPSQRPVARSFDTYFDLCLNRQLGKQSRRRWFETQPRPLLRHCNGLTMHIEIYALLLRSTTVRWNHMTVVMSRIADKLVVFQ